VPQQAPSLVIFDCDGVLVDSEPISVAVLIDIVTAGGGTVSEEAAYLRFLGMSMSSVGTILAEEFGFEMTERHLEAMRSELGRRFKRELKPMPGVREALNRLGGRRCVASSSGIDRIRLSLGVTGLLELFEPDIYSASMVERGKPAPDLFLHAASAMGVPPQACVVIEDSPAGVTAAQRAGMRVFGFTGGSHARRAALAEALAALSPDALFDDMARLPELLATHGRRKKVS
jgi:HAD superfamily hydrolase (TIGR01509 family)